MAKAKAKSQAIKLKNTLNQVLPILLFDDQKVIYQRNLKRKEVAEFEQSAITPALQSMIDNKLLRVR